MNVIKKLMRKLMRKLNVHPPQWYVYDGLYRSWRKMNQRQSEEWGTAGDVEGEIHWLDKRDRADWEAK